MLATLFSFVLLAGIVGGGIWAISVKVREFSAFVKEKGWQEVRKKIWAFCMLVLRVALYTVIGIVAIIGFIAPPMYFEDFFVNEDVVTFYILAYLVFISLIFYYFDARKRRKTWNIKLLLQQDFIAFKKGLGDFMRGIGVLAKALLILAGWLLAAAGIILLIVLFGWFIGSLSATTIIIILLVLILLK